MIDMTRKDILPAMSAYTARLAKGIAAKKGIAADLDTTYEEESLKRLSALVGTTYRAVETLEEDLLASKSVSDTAALAEFYKTKIREDMSALRIPVDEMEMIASAEAWPYPSYGDMLFSVR